MFSHFFQNKNNSSDKIPDKVFRQNINEGIQKILDENRARYQIPGIHVSISSTGCDFPRDFVSGTTTLNGTTSVTTDTLFRIGSITKSFTAVALLKLEAEGLLSLDDTIKKWLPQVPPSWESITIRQLLNHTSGLADYIHIAHDWEKQWLPDELVGFVHNELLHFSPGAGWEYCNTNYLLASMIIHAVTKKTTEEIINDRLLKPLQLSNTYFLPRSCNEDILPRMAHGYASRMNEYPKLPLDVTSYNFSYGDAAFAMISTSHDIAIWLRKLVDGSLLPPEQQKELMNTVNFQEESIQEEHKKAGYGLGIQHDYSSFGEESWWHGGRVPGCRSYMVWLKESDIIITTIINASIDRDTNPVLISDLVAFIQKLEISQKLDQHIPDKTETNNYYSSLMQKS